jgi:uncharacterized protein YbcI
MVWSLTQDPRSASLDHTAARSSSAPRQSRRVGLPDSKYAEGVRPQSTGAPASRSADLSVSFLSSDSAPEGGENGAGLPSARFDPATTGPHGLAISNLVVRLLSEHTGRGATQARTHFNDNLVTVVVQDLMTKGEHSLIRDGRGDLVLETRRAYQEAMGDELSAGVQDITGRRVIAFLSANHLDPDIAIESFMLAPGDG